MCVIVLFMDYRSRAVRWLLGATAHPGGLALTAHLLDRMHLAAGSTVADVACGSGATLELLARRGHRTVGVDVHASSPRTVVGDAQALPLASASYDGVLCECSLSTFDRPESALGEMRRVLRPGGVIGLTDVVLHRDRASAAARQAVDRLTTARTMQEYAALVEQAGLEVVAIEDRNADAAALMRRLRRRLPLSRTLRACEQAVQDGAVSYGLLIARLS